MFSKCQETLRTPVSSEPSDWKSEGLMSVGQRARQPHVTNNIRRRGQRGLTNVAGAAAGALVAHLTPSALAVRGIGDVHVLVAVAAAAVDVGRDGDDLVAVDVGLAARAEADVKPGPLLLKYQRASGAILGRRAHTRPVCVTRFSSVVVVPLMGEANAMQTSARAKMKSVKADMLRIVGWSEGGGEGGVRVCEGYDGEGRG